MARREADWLRQGERDLAHARVSQEADDYEWACYAAHQAAEKAVKALLQSLGVDVWGKSATAVLAETAEGVSIPEHLVELVKSLDHHNLAARYPDAHPKGAPLDIYADSDAADAIEAAEEVVLLVRRQLAFA